MVQDLNPICSEVPRELENDFADGVFESVLFKVVVIKEGIQDLKWVLKLLSGAHFRDKNQFAYLCINKGYYVVGIVSDVKYIGVNSLL